MLRQGFKGKNVTNSFREENGSKCFIPLKSVGSWLNFDIYFLLFDVCNIIVFLSFIWLHDNYEHILRQIWTFIYIKGKCYIHQLYGWISSLWNSARYFWWKNFVAFWFGVGSQYFVVILSVLHHSGCNLAKYAELFCNGWCVQVNRGSRHWSVVVKRHKTIIFLKK